MEDSNTNSTTDNNANTPSSNDNKTGLSAEDIANNAFKKDTEPPRLDAIGAKPKSPKKKFSLKNLTKKQKIIIAVIAAVVLIGGGFAVWWFVFRDKGTQPAVVEVVEEAPAPTTVPSKLTGLQVPPEYNQRTVTAVMIENSPDARPQSGLKDAGVVYEAIAEGGITRFMAVYQDTEPDYVGPVRSARPYYLRWALPYEAGYAHVGGSPTALAEIKSLGIRDIDQFSNPGAFERISSRYAPHNVYTGIPKLRAVEAEKGWTTSNFTGFERKEEATVDPATINARVVNLAISSALYNVTYTYDPATNSYLRAQGGAAHMDERANAQISPKVVVALAMEKGIASDGQHSTYGTIGSGEMFVFQDGTVQKGTWKKDSDSAQFQFLDSSGNPLKLNPGQTWISMVGAPDLVTWQP